MAHNDDCYFISNLEMGFLLADPHASSSVTDGGNLELSPLPKSCKPCAAELQLAWPHRAADLQWLFPRTQKVVGTLWRGSPATQRLLFNRMVKPQFTWAFTSAPEETLCPSHTVHYSANKSEADWCPRTRMWSLPIGTNTRWDYKEHLPWWDFQCYFTSSGSRNNFNKN